MNDKADKPVRVLFEPFNIAVEAAAGSTVLEAALDAGVHINASCGGEGFCGKCRITIEQGSVQGGISEQISAADAEAGVRQACLAVLREDVVVRVPVESALDKVALKALASGGASVAKLIGAEQLKAEGRFDPALAKVVVSADAPTLADNRNDVARLLSALREKGESDFVFRFEAIHDLPNAWREGDWTVTTTILRPVGRKHGRNQVTRVEAGDTSDCNLAAAIDLGTTTVWAQLIDLNSGAVLGTEGDFNAQISFGEDVISRIVHAAKPGGLKRLQEAAVNPSTACSRPWPATRAPSWRTSASPPWPATPP